MAERKKDKFLRTVFLQNETVVDRTIVLTQEARHVLGPDLVYERCTIVLRRKTWRTFTTYGCAMTGCTIEARPALKQAWWWNALLVGCKFVGNFSDNEFGRRAELGQGNFGGLRDCDFRGADVSGVRLFNVDIASLQFPPWPFFVLRSPQRFAERISSVEWPSRMRPWANRLADQPEETSAVVHNAVRSAGYFGAEPEDLREPLTQLGPEVVLFPGGS